MLSRTTVSVLVLGSETMNEKDDIRRPFPRNGGNWRAQNSHQTGLERPLQYVTAKAIIQLDKGLEEAILRIEDSFDYGNPNEVRLRYAAELSEVDGLGAPWGYLNGIRN